ncbi:Noc2-domain-containing protein [Serendipita vermifera]|nr:Noc2-domain-containing protein [Serendipita vermifera]
MKTKKSSRKYAASGKLKQAIQARHKHQKVKKRIEAQKARKTKNQQKGTPAANGREGRRKAESHASDTDEDEEDEGEEDRDVEMAELTAKQKRLRMEADSDDGNESQDENDEESESEGEEDDDDNASFSSIDDLDDDDGAAHMVELSKLAEKDPEFYKYLQENDKDLLNFKAEEPDTAISDEEMEAGIPDEDDDEDEPPIPVLTQDILRSWQTALLKHRSLKALRKLIVAFRAAAYANEEGVTLAWSIDNPQVFDKVVTTALKYTPVVLEHHIPFRSLPNGKYKPPIQSTKQQSLTRLVSTFFTSTMYLLGQLSNPQLVIVCLSESAKLVPYIIGNRKIVRNYLKSCLSLWSSPNVDTEDKEEEGESGDFQDRVRIAAFLSLRRVAMGSDESLLDMVLKGTYTTLLKISKATSAHFLPAINLMKNTAVELYLLDHATSYQHAFGYIRQLAVNLRSSIKVRVTGPKDDRKEEKSRKGKVKEPYKQVYNWQFVHCVDFWSLLLSRACEGGQEDELQPLIYPLVQVTLGAVKLVPNPRYYPLHLHLLQSLLNLSNHTRAYIPLPPYILPVISSLTSVSKPKPSTMKPLDLDLVIRAPSSYVKTRIFIDGILEESLYLLAEWGANVQDSVAFPEIMVPVVAGLKRCIKASKQGHGGGQAGGKAGAKSGEWKGVKQIKTLVDRIEEGGQWVQDKRRSISFAPDDRAQIDRWESGVKRSETPLGKYANVLRKARERSKKVLEMARKGEGEFVKE